VAAVAAAIAVHGRATHASHAPVLRQWADRVRAVQIDPASGLVIQRMSATTGVPHDAPRASGTGLAAYFAGLADRGVAELVPLIVTYRIVRRLLELGPIANTRRTP
jgi:hypothetical protein